MPEKLFKPGEKAPRSGQYEITGPRGGKTGVERTITRGEPLPPPESKEQKYRLSDLTKHRKTRLKVP
ncbi:YjzC family protein [Sneathiella aquimaris]|uniref:YjzC family protein n=1 Tax=Sneathiella aquimaris TaxID=2599305 RepID=UPI00146AAD3F